MDDQDDSCFHSKRICVHMNSGKSIQEEFKIIYRGRVYWIRANETPGWVPEFTDDTEEDDTYSSEEGEVEQKNVDFEAHSDGEKVQETVFENDGKEQSHVDENNSEKNRENSDDPPEAEEKEINCL